MLLSILLTILSTRYYQHDQHSTLYQHYEYHHHDQHYHHDQQVKCIEKALEQSYLWGSNLTDSRSDEGEEEGNTNPRKLKELQRIKKSRGTSAKKIKIHAMVLMNLKHHPDNGGNDAGDADGGGGVQGDVQEGFSTSSDEDEYDADDKQVMAEEWQKKRDLRWKPWKYSELLGGFGGCVKIMVLHVHVLVVLVV